MNRYYTYQSFFKTLSKMFSKTVWENTYRGKPKQRGFSFVPVHCLTLVALLALANIARGNAFEFSIYDEYLGMNVTVLESVSSFEKISLAGNDECVDAISLTVGGAPVSSLDVTTYTDSGNNLSCDGGSSSEDAYYSFVAPNSGLVLIDVDNANLSGSFTTYVEGALYASCADAASNTEIACFPWSDDLSSGQVVSGLTPGNTYFLEVEHYNNDWTGTYDISITDLTSPLSLGVKECSYTFHYPSVLDETCPYSCSDLANFDGEAIFTYTPIANQTIDVLVTDIALPTSGAEVIGFIFTEDPNGATCLGQSCSQPASNAELSATGISVVAGTTYFLIVNIDGFASSPEETFCVQINAPCTGSTGTTSAPTVDCAAGTYTGRINFSALGTAATYDLEDDAGNAYSGIAASTDYDFNFTDVLNHTITLKGYDGSANLVCVEEFTVSSACNGSDAWSAAAPNILGTCFPGDLSSANVEVTGSTPICDGGGASGSTGNNVIRDCSNANYDNNTDFIDLWYQVDLPDGSDEMTLTVNGLGANEILGYVIHTGDPGASSNNAVATVDGSFECSFFDQFITSHTITGLADESTAPIYIRILAINFNDADGCPGMVHPDFTICASAPQPNDICSNALDIDDIAVAGNLCAANADTESTETCDTGSNCSACTETSEANDLWYQVTMDAADNNQMLELDITFPNASDAVLVTLYSGCFPNAQLDNGDFGNEIAACGIVSSTGAGATVTYQFNATITAGGTGPDYYVRVAPATGNSVCDFTIQGRRVAVNNACEIANETSPTSFIITNPVVADFNFATASGADGQADADLWYVFDPIANTDVYDHSVYSTSADVTVSGLNAGEEITLMLYKRHGSIGANCTDLAGDFLSSLSMNSDGTASLTCLDEIHGTSGTGDGYILRILQTAGGSNAVPTVTVAPSTDVAPFNNSCENIWDGTGATILGSTGIDAAHDYNAYVILNGETISGNFTAATDCDAPIDSAFCNAVDYEAIQEVNDRDMWYVFTVPDNQCASLGITQSTVVESMDFTYNANDQTHDGILYIYSACGDANLIACSGSLNGEGETWTATGLTQGESYLLRVKPWDISSAQTDWAFDITLNEGNPMPCNDDPANAYNLDVACYSYDALETWSAQGASQTAPVDGAPENDVWFTFTAPSPANGGSYTTPQSWVTVFFESVSAHSVYAELYNTMTTSAAGEVYNTAASAGDKKWAVFGNLVPGRQYYIRLYHKQLATVDVQYKIRINDGTATEPGWDCGEVSMSNLSGCTSGCNDLREMWFKIDLPTLTPGNMYWTFEVTGMDQKLDFEMRSKYLNGSTTYVLPCNGTDGASEGNCADFDHPCSSVALEPAVNLVYTSPSITGCDGNDMLGDLIASNNNDTDNDNTPGSGVRKVYFNMNGAVPGQKDYYYMRVFVDPTDPRYADWAEVKICDISMKGPYLTQPEAVAAGIPEESFCTKFDYCDLGTDLGYPVVFSYYNDSDDNGRPEDNDQGPAVWLGDIVDSENSSWTVGEASSDDANGDDEDGLFIFNPGFPQVQVAEFEVVVQANNANTQVFSNLWIDWDVDGLFDSTYQVSVFTLNPKMAMNATATAVIPVNIPAGYSLTSDPFNVRIMASPNPIPVNGFGTDIVNGEIEGYKFNPSDIIDPNLPLELKSFTGEPMDDHNMLYWSTASEINVSHFLVERSTDGNGFQAMGMVNAVGNSNVLQSYEFMEERPDLLTYYRLKMVDEDGTYEYSNIITIERRAITKPYLALAPVPTTGLLTLDFFTETDDEITFRILDARGRLLKEVTTTMLTGNKLELDLSAYAEGVYLIHMEDKNLSITKRFVKVNQ